MELLDVLGQLEDILSEGCDIALDDADIDTAASEELIAACSRGKHQLAGFSARLMSLIVGDAKGRQRRLRIERLGECARMTSFEVEHALKAVSVAEVGDALIDGGISQRQAEMIADTCERDERCLDELLDVACTGGVEELKCAARKYTGTDTPAARARHAEKCERRRFVRTWVDHWGMVQGHFCLHRDEGDFLNSLLALFGDKLGTAGNALGPSQGRADALMALLRGERLPGEPDASEVEDPIALPPPRYVRPEVVLHVDFAHLCDHWARGDDGAGSTTIINGLGYVPMGVAELLRTDAILSVLLTKDGALKGFGRTTRMTSRLRAAILARDGCCQVPGCDEERDLQIDHIEELSCGGKTVSENLITMCARHHGDKTFAGFHLEGRGENLRWVSPADCVCDRAKRVEQISEAGVGAQRYRRQEAERNADDQRGAGGSGSQPDIA